MPVLKGALPCKMSTANSYIWTRLVAKDAPDDWAGSSRSSGWPCSQEGPSRGRRSLCPSAQDRTVRLCSAPSFCLSLPLGPRRWAAFSTGPFHQDLGSLTALHLWMEISVFFFSVSDAGFLVPWDKADTEGEWQKAHAVTLYENKF